MSYSLRERIRGWFLTGHRLEVLRIPSSLLSTAGTTRPHLIRFIRFLSGTLFLLPLIVIFAALAIVPIVTPPMPRLPEPGDAGAILGTLLTAQAAIAALTLAVTLFMMQGIRAKTDIDDRMYREYFRRSGVRGILWGSLLAVGVTGELLLSEGFISGDVATADVRSEFRNFVLAGGLAFLLNLVFAGVLFQKAIHHSRPEQWMDLRRDVNKRDVRQAIQAFLRRARRAHAAREANEPDLTILVPDRGEGSADEAVRGLLDDARRAMSERRHQELGRSLDSIRELVKYAMDEMKALDIKWGDPGSHPEWPPLRELGRALYSFREDVIREGDRDYILELLRLDHWLISTGVREGCGELFSVGLDGYRYNYQIGNRIGSEYREMLRDRFSLHVDTATLGIEPLTAYLYVKEMIRHQERILSDAIHIDQPGDFEQLHRGFNPRLRAIRSHWKADDWPTSEASELSRQLEQEYRIAVMGLAGRAIELARLDRIRNVNPYLDVGRAVHGQLGLMGDDLAAALVDEDRSRISIWEDWEFEDAETYQVIGISTERYPLTFFTLRLLELSSDETPSFDLHGRAQQVLDWFTANWESAGAYVLVEPNLTLEQRRDFATNALSSAVRRDEVAEDYDIIGRELSATRVSAFKSDVYSAAIPGNSVEQWFKRTGAFLHLSSDAADAPNKQQVDPQPMHKGFSHGHA